MKTIFLSIYDGDSEKNILRSSVFQRLKNSGIQIILLIRGANRLQYYKNKYASENVFVELLPPANSKAEKIWYHISRNFIPTHAVYVRNYREYRIHKKLLRFFFERFLSWCAHFKIFRECVRTIYWFLGEDYAQDLFKKYKPDLVFAQNMFSPEDVRLLRAAKHRNVPTVTTAKSWDVLTTKAFTRVKADRMIVFNEYNKKEAIEIGDYSPTKVVVTGFPQFDIYKNKEIIKPREEFLNSLGFTKNDRYVFYSIPGDWKLPYTREILEELNSQIENGNFKEPLKIYAEIHPKYSDPSESMQAEHVFLRRPGTYFSEEGELTPDSGLLAKEWTFTQKDIVHLANTIYHADLVVCTDSTLSLDSAALDRPAVLIAYDGDVKLPYKDSIAFIYEREHYQNVLNTKGVFRVYGHEELVQAINKYLENPDYLKDERKILKQKLLYKNDDRAGERMAQAVLELLP